MRSGYIKAQRSRNANGFWRETLGPHAGRRDKKAYEGMFVYRNSGRNFLAIGHIRRRNALGCRNETVAISYDGELGRAPGERERQTERHQRPLATRRNEEMFGR